MDIDILVEDNRWDELALEVLVNDAVCTTLTHLALDDAGVEISVLACDDARIAVLNAEFRDKVTPTNVLSWPAEDLAADKAGETPALPESGADGCMSLGDIAIAFDTCQREAQELNKPIAAHVTHLIVHGTLHLLGYDHLRDPDADLMQGLETEILGKMGLDDPYWIQ